MKLRISLFGVVILSALAIGNGQIVKADNLDTTLQTQIKDEESESEDSGVLAGGIKWELDSSGVLHLSGGTLDQTAVEESYGIMDLQAVSEKAVQIDIEGPIILPANSSALFLGWTEVTKINGLNNLKTDDVTDMSFMFAGCISLESLDLSSFQTDRVTNMSNMFVNLISIKSLTVPFNTEQVTEMIGMFSGCQNLEKLDISSFDTSNVELAFDLFDYLPNLKSLVISDKFVVPDDQIDSLGLSAKKWINIGTGTQDNPKPQPESEQLSFAELLEQDNQNQWVIEPSQKYTGTQTVELLTSDGETIALEIPEEQQPEYIGSTLEIKVPTKEGYTVTPETVKVQATAEGLVVTNLDGSEVTVDYTKIPTKPTKPSNPGPTYPVEEDPVIMKEDRLVTVNPQLTSASLYNSKGQKLTSKSLAGNSNWYSDQMMELDGVEYYRVASDEWIKAEDVYQYQKFTGVVKTLNKEITLLKNSLGKTISNRGLARLTNWKTDKLVKIADQEYYRVSTDEFISVAEVEVQ